MADDLYKGVQFYRKILTYVVYPGRKGLRNIADEKYFTNTWTEFLQICGSPFGQTDKRRKKFKILYTRRKLLAGNRLKDLKLRIVCNIKVTKRFVLGINSNIWRHIFSLFFLIRNDSFNSIVLSSAKTSH